MQDVDDKIDYPQSVKFAKDTLWLGISSSNMKHISDVDKSFKEKLDLVRKKLNNSSHNKLPVMLRHQPFLQ